MLHIIWNSLTKRKVQSLATLTGVAVGVAILFAVFLLYKGIAGGMEMGKNRLGADLLVVPAEARVHGDKALFTGAPMNIYMDRKYLDAIASIPGVKGAAPQFFTQTLNEDCCTLATPTRLIGFDPAKDWIARALLNDAGMDALAPDEILMGGKVEGYLGNQVGILGEPFRIKGILAPTGTGLDHAILMPMDTALRLAKNSDKLQSVWRQAGNPDDLLSAVLVALDDPADRDRVTAAIDNLGSLQIIAPSDEFQNMKEQMDTLLLLLLGGGLLAAFASLFQLFGRFFSLAWDRRSEWGLYRALGASRRDLFLLVTGEALLLSAGGALAGILLGSLFYRLSLGFLQTQHGFPYLDPSPGVLISGALLTLAAYLSLGFLAALAPAIQGGRIDPSSAMARGDID